MRRVLFFALFLSLLSSIFCATMTAIQKQDAVEPNHFYSSSKNEKLYNLGSLIKDKPLAVVLKAPSEDYEYTNPITLTISIGSQKKECNFRSLNDLCTLESISEEKGSMNIKCQKTPCEATWKVIQPEINQLKDSDHIEKFYKISSDDPRKMHLSIICTDIEINNIEKMFKVYSDVSFLPFFNERKSYILFQSPKKSYIYFQMSKQFKACASIKMDRIPAAISKDVTSDLLTNKKAAQYSLDDLPDNDFRLDIGLHIIAPSTEEKNKFNIKISGEKNQNRISLRQSQIMIPDSEKTFDISYAVPKIGSDYKKVQIQFTTNIGGVLLDFNSGSQPQQLVQANQISYFDLKKGEKLQYKLVSEPKANDQKIKIILFNDKKIKSSKNQCNVKQGCQFQIQAIDDAKGNIILAVGNQNQMQFQQPVIIELGSDNKYTKKMKQGQKVYLKKNIQKDKGFQTIINTINAIVYMATNKKCDLPSHQCYNSIGTLQRHFVFFPHSEGEKQAIFMVEALDNCEFTLQLLFQEGAVIRLEDSKPFSYLFDQDEDEIKFIFTRSKKTDTSFNLVGPFNALDLIVQNQKKISKDYEDAQISSEGFLQFKASQAKNDDFSIVVRKRDSHKQSFVHFVLIVSTLGKQVRLESGMSYYETLPKNIEHQEKPNNAEYIFEFNVKQDYVLNFYSHNMQEESVKIFLALSASNENWKDKDKVMKMEIDKASDVLDLSDVSQKLCINSGQGQKNCELFMKLLNPTDREIDIAITLITRQAIIQMHSGVWQSFNLHSVAKSAHFYYQPKKKDSDVNLYFKSSDPGLRLSYLLYAGSYDTINPTQWPFPQKLSDEQKKQHSEFRPARHFSISAKTLSQCYPYCLILMSVLEVQKNEIEGNFSLMASDSITEIPEKQKFDIVLSAEEEKLFLIDLKYAIDQDQDIFFYSQASIGVVNIYGSVISEKNDRVPDEDEHDFQLYHQTVIPIEKIKEIIQQESMDEHNNIYLQLVIIAVSDSKIAIQIGFDEKDEQNAKLISLDTFERIIMPAKSTQIFYSIIDQPFQLKITRENGFPFLYTINCKQKLGKCIEQIKDSENQGKQILTKISATTAVPCPKCFYFFKITTKEDPATVQLHLQSKSSEIELSESKSVYDFTQAEQPNNYILYAVRGEQIFINLDVSEGEVEVYVTDLHEIDMKKTGSTLISFTIPTESRSVESKKKQQKNEKLKNSIEEIKQKSRANGEDKNLPKQLIKFLKKQSLKSQTYLSTFGLSQKFIVLHIRVSSTNKNKQSIYTISYSSGEIQFDLQDGLITEYQLEGEKQSTFYYSTKHRGHAYLVISMDKSKYLQDLSVSLKYCEPKDDIIDEDCWIQFKTDKPPIKDKTPNPTIMYSLPAYNYFAISLNYAGSGSAKVTIGINHQEVILLPMQKQFPFVLHQKQNISMLAEISNPGYIYATVRKCDDSSPTFAYTFDYDSFQQDDFNYETTLSDNPKTQFFSKVTPGTMYIRFSSPSEMSLMSVYLKFSVKKTKQTSMGAGGKGELQYSIIDSRKAQLTFKPPVCSDSSCTGKIKYYLMTATKKRDLYSQLVCPSNYFSMYEAISADPIKDQELVPKQNSDGTLSLNFQLVDQISYVGVRANDSKGHEVFYNPIQVATIWGQLSRTSHTHKWSIFSVVIFCLLALVIFVRRKSREGYKPIEEEY